MLYIDPSTLTSLIIPIGALVYNINVIYCFTSPLDSTDYFVLVRTMEGGVAKCIYNVLKQTKDYDIVAAVWIFPVFTFIFVTAKL